MKNRWMMMLVAIIFWAQPAVVQPVFAGQSTITTAEGTACMGDELSRKQTEQAALADARRQAAEFASTYLKSETEVKNYVLDKDLRAAYSNARVKIIRELKKSWYRDPAAGECCRVKIEAEVIPDTKALERMAAARPAALDDPSAPLRVRAWTDRKRYREGQKVTIYLKGNKPFYARVLYKNADGTIVQLLPNPFRTANYFNGGVIYQIPGGNDRFDLEVSPPFGSEDVIVYASTSPLGKLSTEARGGVYQVKTAARDIGMKTRGIKLLERPGSSRPSGSMSGAGASEFFEDKVVVKTWQ